MTTFSTAEREFLRLTADASVGHDELAEAVTADLDWHVLRELAMNHQLDGVLAWRVLSEPLRQVVPADARDQAARVVAGFEPFAERWKADAQLVMDALSTAGVDFVMVGGPLPYEPYLLPHWPRPFSDIDLVAPGSQAETVWQVFRSLGEVPTPDWHARTTLPHGTPVLCRSTPPAMSHNYAALWSDPALVARGPMVSRYGLTIPAPTPAAQIVSGAMQEYDSITADTAPLPLHGISQVHNLMQHYGVSTDDIRGLLAELAARDADQQEARGREARFSQQESLLHGVHLIFEVASRVYGLPSDLATPFSDALTVAEGAFLAYNDHETFSHQQRYRWGAWPGDEEFIFDCYDLKTPAQRVAASIWTGPHSDWEAVADEHYVLSEFMRVRPEDAASSP